MGAEQGPKAAGKKRTFNKTDGDKKGGRQGDNKKGGNNFKKRDFKAQGK